MCGFHGIRAKNLAIKKPKKALIQRQNRQRQQRQNLLRLIHTEGIKDSIATLLS